MKFLSILTKRQMSCEAKSQENHHEENEEPEAAQMKCNAGIAGTQQLPKQLLSGGP